VKTKNGPAYWKQHPQLLVSDVPGKTALECLTNGTFPTAFAEESSLARWDEAVLRGAYVNLELGDFKDNPVVAAFRKRGIRLTGKRLNMDNYAGAHTGNAYLHVPPDFKRPIFLAENVLDSPDGDGLCRLSGKSYAYYLVLRGAPYRLIASDYSNRQVRELVSLHAEDPLANPLPYEPFDYSKTPLFEEKL
jgi:hypothetical protein